jgi:hypothetical protein
VVSDDDAQLLGLVIGEMAKAPFLNDVSMDVQSHCSQLFTLKVVTRTPGDGDRGANPA